MVQLEQVLSLVVGVPLVLVFEMVAPMVQQVVPLVLLELVLP